MKTVSASGNSIKNCLSAARRLLGVTFREAPAIRISDSGDGLYRVALSTGDIVEVTVIHHSRVEAELVS